MGSVKVRSKNAPKNRKSSGFTRSSKRPKLIAFDEDSRKDFITGFRARRLQRQAEAKKALEHKAKVERLQKRKDAKQARNEYFEQLHPSLFKNHKLIDSSDEQEKEIEPQEIIQEFSDDDHNVVVVKTSNDIVLDMDINEAINQCESPLESEREAQQGHANATNCTLAKKQNKKQLKKSLKRSMSRNKNKK